jgi:hypothetical protein
MHHLGDGGHRFHGFLKEAAGVDLIAGGHVFMIIQNRNRIPEQ